MPDAYETNGLIHICLSTRDTHARHPQTLSPGAKADLGVEEVDHRKSKAGRPQPVAHGGERYINKRRAVAHVVWVSALSHLAPLWPPGEDEENSSVTSQQLHKVESSSCQLRVHAAERPLIWPLVKFPGKAPRVCAASTLGPLGSWRVGSPAAILK